MSEQYLSSSILIVDDSDYIRTIMTTLFKKEGLTKIFTAADGLSAVEKYKQLNPDLVVLDIMLPKKNGMDVLEDIMKINPKARVVMISSLASPENVAAAKKAGALYYFVKPYDNQFFLNIIKDILSNRGEN